MAINLGGFDPNFTSRHTMDVTQQIGQQRGRLFNQELQGLTAGGALARGNRAIAVQEGILGLNQRDQQIKEQQMKGQQDFQAALREAARGGLPAIKQFYMQNGMAEQALALEKAESETQKLGLENDKLFQDIQGTIRARGIGDAVQAVLATSENPRAQAALYGMLRKNLAKQGVELPERPTPEIMTVLANQANSVDSMGQKIAQDPQLKKQFGKAFSEVYGPEGQKAAGDIAANLLTEGTTQEFQRGFDPADADPRFVNTTGTNTQDPKDRLTRGELIQAQVKAGLVDVDDLTDDEYESAYGRENLRTKKEADALERESILLEAGIDVREVDPQLAKIDLGEEVLPLGPKRESEEGQQEDIFRQTLANPLASDSERVAAINALAQQGKSRAGIVGMIDALDVPEEQKQSMLQQAVKAEITGKAKGNATNINIDTSKKGLGKRAEIRYQAIAEEALAAEQRIPILTLAENALISNLGTALETGPFGEARTELAKTFGLAGDQVANNELLHNTIVNETMVQVQKTKGSVSEREMDFFMSSVQSLDNTSLGNLILIRTNKALMNLALTRDSIFSKVDGDAFTEEDAKKEYASYIKSQGGLDGMFNKIKSRAEKEVKVFRIMKQKERQGKG